MTFLTCDCGHHKRDHGKAGCVVPASLFEPSKGVCPCTEVFPNEVTVMPVGTRVALAVPIVGFDNLPVGTQGVVTFANLPLTFSPDLRKVMWDGLEWEFTSEVSELKEI